MDRSIDSIDRSTGWIRRITLLLKNRVFALSVLMLTLSLAAIKIAAEVRIVRIVEEGVPLVCYTTQREPEKILEEQEIALAAYDQVSFTGFAGMRGEINITRAFPVAVSADGREQTLMVIGGTVADLLEQAGIALGESDEISHLPQEEVRAGDTVVITRHELVTLQVEAEVPYETRQLLTPVLSPGETQVMEEGESGLRVETYRQKLVDGELVEHRLFSDVLVQEPVDETWLAGFPSRPVSPFNFAWEFDEDGVPADYKNVLYGARAAGYSAPAGAGTASGRPAVVGNVAVNPRVIPYGSKLYIATPDGSFVYGYAVAADTGTSLQNGVIDVDLFYNTYEESARNGIKYVNIYVLE